MNVQKLAQYVDVRDSLKEAADTNPLDPMGHVNRACAVMATQNIQLIPLNSILELRGAFEKVVSALDAQIDAELDRLKAENGR
jgi:hypothetical protein